jgi:hypothetical protein
MDDPMAAMQEILEQAEEGGYLEDVIDLMYRELAKRLLNMQALVEVCEVARRHANSAELIEELLEVVRDEVERQMALANPAPIQLN